MTRQRAIQQLFNVWAVGGVILGIIVAGQVFAGKYGDDGAVALSWFLAVVTPPCSLLGVAAFVDARAAWRNADANEFKYRVALIMSAVLLLMAFGTLALEPLAELSWFDLFALSGVLIGFMQAGMMAAIGSVVFDRR